MPDKRAVLSLIAVFMLAAVAPAIAAEVTQESYKAEVEPICKANTEANEKILKGVKAKVKAGKLDAAAKQIAAAAEALKKTRGKLLQVPQPTEDEARLTKWLGYVKTEVALFEGVATKLAKGETTSAQKLVVRLYSNAMLANNQVLDYEFRYCKLQPSKFI